MTTIPVLKLDTRVLATPRLGGPMELPGVVQGAIYTGAGLRYTIRFDNNFTAEVLADRVREAV